MSELAALGLATNIVQLISFATDLISKGHEIYESADGTLIEHLELEAITESLEELSSGLSEPENVKPLRAKPPPTKAEVRHHEQLVKTGKQLQKLCGGCRKVAKELLGVINTVKVQGRHKRWNSFRQALNSIWKEDEIQALSIRLERYRREIDTTLLVCIRNELEFKNARSSQPNGGVGRLVPPEHWQAELIDVIRQNYQELESKHVTAMFSSRLSATAKYQRKELLKWQALERLRFTEINNRYERIQKAHERTFDWIFADRETCTGTTLSMDEGQNAAGDGRQQNIAGVSGADGRNRQWSSFVRWLQSGERLYWITGKPGSGKSTLMKYLSNHNQTLKHLEHWTGGLRVVMAGFFSWNSGTTMQMSRMGLLQTLLYEAVRGQLELIPHLFPDRWRSYELFGGDLHPWSWSELFRAFNTLISDDSRRFFFLIDGLDEFDGESAELVDFVLETSSNTNVKVCVASRPWLVFEDAFHRQPSLRLEDLTAADIQLFVFDKLRGSTMFSALERLQPEHARRLTFEVTDKAHGVFLWVYLVVHSLLEGLQDGDKIEDLQDRLLQLPSDLEELFRKILDRVNPAYFKQASIFFQLVRSASRPLSLLSLSWAEDGIERAIAAKVKPILPEEITFQTERMRRRVSSRCRGLLESPAVRVKGSEAEVQYLHRTVKDFLARPDIWDYILSGTDDSFDPDLALASAFLRHAKTLVSRVCTLDALRDLCMEHSRKVETRAKDTYIPILCELDRTAAGLTNTQGRCLTSTSFFNSAFQYQLYSYVKYTLSGGYSPNSLLAGNYLLFAAILSRDIEMVKLLFEYGANPNVHSDHCMTPWKHLLCGLEGAAKIRGARDNWQDWAELVEIFLQNGADAWVIVNNVRADRIITAALGDWDEARISEMLSTLAALRKAQKSRLRLPHRLGGLLGRFSEKPRTTQ